MDELVLPIYLNHSWRLSSDGMQWRLEEKDNASRSGWRPRGHAMRRERLFALISKLCGVIEPEARELLDSLPLGHP